MTRRWASVLDPTMVEDGDGVCDAPTGVDAETGDVIECGGYMTWHRHPHYPYVDIDCEVCGRYVIDPNVEPGTEGHRVRYPSDAELLHRLEMSPPGNEPDRYSATAAPAPPDEFLDGEPF
jgi:hypothetical protein